LTLLIILFLYHTPSPPLSTLLPYTTLFRSRIDNRPELVEQLKGSRGANSSTPDSLLALLAYVQWGKSFPARMVGDFALALFDPRDRKSTRLNSSHVKISYAVFCLKKKNTIR